MWEPALQVFDIGLSDLEIRDEGHDLLNSTQNSVFPFERMLPEEALKSSQFIVLPAKEVRVRAGELVQIRIQWSDSVCLLKCALHLIYYSDVIGT